MSFRIASIQTRIVEYPLRPERVIVSAAGRHDRSRFLIVEVRDPDGVGGYGEAAITTLWSGESAETAQWMVERCFAPALVGHSFDHPREALALMDLAAYGNPFAKSAVDTAMWDLWTRRDNLPAYERFRDREPVGHIPTRASIGAYTVADTVRIAENFWEAGIRTLKFKVGVSGVDDVARLRAVRERLGEGPVFTVDANGAYRRADAAVAAIEELLPFKVAMVEQPTPRDRIGLMAEVRKRVPVPIIADESIFTPDHLDEALAGDAFDILSVYPGKDGGFTRALEMARTAARAGKPCAIGSNLETDLGQAAMAMLAAGLSAFPVTAIAGDLAAALYYQQSAVTSPLELRDGCLAVPRGPGFGVVPLGAATA
jgi:L-alanine-DL-glutamate epimerase-like enolase superfamily enzyme